MALESLLNLLISFYSYQLLVRFGHGPRGEMGAEWETHLSGKRGQFAIAALSLSLDTNYFSKVTTKFVVQGQPSMGMDFHESQACRNLSCSEALSKRSPNESEIVAIPC